jgi:hypothetical protein
LTVRVEEPAREALALEAAALSEAVVDPETSAGYADLSRALVAGEVAEPLLPPLERLLELTLRSGRVRRLHGPHAEAAAVRLYQATPAGRELGSVLSEVNTALAALRGRELEGITFASKGPGAYGLAIRTADAQVSLEIGPEGVAVRDVSVGE